MKVFIALLVLLMCAGCIQQSKTIQELSKVEVRDYRGEKLSSIADFRENSIAGPQKVNITSYRLQITGLVEDPKSFSYEQVLDHQRYRKVILLHCVEGWSVNLLWDGVLVKDLIDDAGVRPEANTVIFYAVDGYSTSLPISYIRDRNILLAYGMNNVTLPAERGYPFELVAEDKWGYKWIKWVERIELSNDSNYSGYWESQGYSNGGDLGSRFLN
jgi:DMSO/TMAO reductase YedYZ molybdopterin-dependent catalytic subunit